MEEASLEKEQEQMRRLVSLQKVAGLILRKWSGVLIAVFLGLAVVFSLFMVAHFAKSGHRFDATTQLLYNPRQIARIQNMSEKQLFTVLDRASIKRRVGEVLPMDLAERQCLGIDLEVVQERRPTNLFRLTAHAPTWKGAVKKVNAYAEMLIEGYEEYRKKDLETWRESLERRKETLQGQIAEIESEENVLKGKAGVAAPAEMLTMITGLLTDQRRNLSMLGVQVANEEQRKKKLEGIVGSSGTALSDNAAIIRRKSEEIAALDREIAKLRELYTDINPKVSGKLDERAALVAEYTEFLQQKGIGNVNLDAIDNVEKASGELAETMLRLEVIHENQRALEQEIKANEKRTEELTAVIPAFDRLRIRRADLEQTLRDLDDQIENIAYLQMSVRNDLRQIERAGGAGDKNPFRPKNFAFALGGAIFGTLALAFWILVLEFLLGRVVDGRELKAYDDVFFLGSLPAPGKLPEQEERDVLGVVALKFIGADVPRSVVLVCRLPGAEPQPKFREALDWSLTMSGERSFVLEIVQSSSFQPPEECETLLCAVKKGDSGWFPVDNRYTLAPTELQMLQADLATLRGEYDHVFVTMQGGVRRGGSFFSQVLGACDSALVVAGSGTTPRSWLAYARRHVKAAERPAMGLATGVGTKVVKAEMEARE